VAAAAAANGFLRLDPLPILRRYLTERGIPPTPENRRRLFYFPRDGHPTALGHALLAEALALQLAEMGVASPAAADAAQ